MIDILGIVRLGRGNSGNGPAYKFDIVQLKYKWSPFGKPVFASGIYMRHRAYIATGSHTSICVFLWAFAEYSFDGSLRSQAC